MRAALILVALACGGVCRADRLISIPLGRKIPFRSLRLESFAEAAHARSLDYFAGIGVTPEFEVDYHAERIDGSPIRSTFDFSYNYIAPITDQAPGISAGVQDVLNQTRDGRREYIALTWRTGLETGSVPLETTLGVVQGHHLMAFVGVMLPFSDTFRFLVEDNGLRIASGIDVRLWDSRIGLRAVVRDRDVMFGANLSYRF